MGIDCVELPRALSDQPKAMSLQDTQMSYSKKPFQPKSPYTNSDDTEILKLLESA